MADISRNTTPAWQDPHLKDRGDYTEQDIQNIQGCVLASWRPLCERCFSAV